MKVDLFLMALSILNDATLTEEFLEEILVKLALINPNVTNEELHEVRFKLESQIGVRGFKGIGLTEPDQAPWLDLRKAENPNWEYWNAYKTWIRKRGFSSDVIRVLDEDTDAILSECGDPLKEGLWGIKGLVMGDVQSGKTANYAGLINKAADTGYKVIILLTGMIEELRAQTQSRLDEDFAGIDSEKRMQKEEKVIGVGLYKKRTPPAVLTSVDKDFLTDNLKLFGGVPLTTLASKEPVLLVLKKNSSVLRSLLNYLRSQVLSGDKTIDLPLFLVDDEADNASINTKTEDNPATINQLIRDVRDIFGRSTYCAYTATPFANVFIDPNEESNLFPENFVYTLHSPTSYVGAASIFLENGEHNNHLVDIDDAESYFPEKHKKDLKIDDIPDSLKESIQTFFITCCIRDLRKENLKHRSMLINVSRFTDVQGRIAEIVSIYSYNLKEEIRQYLASDSSWKHHQLLQQLKHTFESYFTDAGVTWDQIRKSLWESVSSIKTITVNQKTQDEDRLNYQHYKKTTLGRRVIAIGGLTLSRGLTLEGLSTSYFYRNSKAYDTLLQMGRWFGYRNGYADLCKIWMTKEVQDWYAHLAEVVDELRQDIRSMHVRNKKPRDFGMRVMAHPGLLLVTARNKMKTSKEVEIRVSFSKFMTETPYLIKSEKIQKNNLDITLEFIDSLKIPSENKGRRIWSCSKEKVAAYLTSMDISPLNNAFISTMGAEEHPLIKFIRDTKSLKMQEWDIALPQGDSKPIQEIKILDEMGVRQPIKPRGRQFEKSTNNSEYLKINHSRVGGGDDETICIDQNIIEKVKASWIDGGKGKSVPGKNFREYRTKPLLTINLIVPIEAREKSIKNESVDLKKSRRQMMSPIEVGAGPFVALSLYFPNLDLDGEENQTEIVSYRLNKIALMELGLIEEDDDDATD